MTRRISIDLRDMPQRKSVTTARVSDVLAIASDITDVHHRDITGTPRFPEIVRVRQACFLISREAGHSYPEIARRMNRDHSAVHYGVKIAWLRERADAEYGEFVAELRARVAANGRTAPAPRQMAAEFVARRNTLTEALAA